MWTLTASTGSLTPVTWFDSVRTRPDLIGRNRVRIEDVTIERPSCSVIDEQVSENSALSQRCQPRWKNQVTEGWELW